MDREDAYPDQSCAPMGNHREALSRSQWDELCSSASADSLSSEDELKPPRPGQGDMYSPEMRDYPPAVVSLLPPNNSPAGMGGGLERGAHPYSGTERRTSHLLDFCTLACSLSTPPVLLATMGSTAFSRVAPHLLPSLPQDTRNIVSLPI